MVASKSLASRRHLPSQARVRSTLACTTLPGFRSVPAGVSRWVARATGSGRDAEDNFNVRRVNLYPANQGPDDVSLTGEVEFFEATTNFGCELFKSAYNEGKLVFGLCSLDGRLVPFAEPEEPGLEACNPWFELQTIYQPLGVAVDQPTDATLQAGHLTVELSGFVGLANFMRLRKAAMIFLFHPARDLKERADPVPHDLLKRITADLAIVTNGGTAKPESIRAGATVIAILAFRSIGF